MELHIERIKLEPDSTTIDVEKVIEKLREENPEYNIYKKGLSYSDNYAVISYSKTKKKNKPKHKNPPPRAFGLQK